VFNLLLIIPSKKFEKELSRLYDRDGKLVVQSIDMGTRRQFWEMLGEAGLK
jgi:hypothetical protein